MNKVTKENRHKTKEYKKASKETYQAVRKPKISQKPLKPKKVKPTLKS